MRLAYLIQADKSVHFFQITDNMQLRAAVLVTWPHGKPLLTASSDEPWILEEQGNVLKALSDIIFAIKEAGDKATPHSLLAAVDAAKGKQVAVDFRGRLRNVSTMADGEAEFEPVGCPKLESITVDTKDRDDEEVESIAKDRLNDAAAAMMADDETDDDTVATIRKWIKGGRKVKKLAEGRKPEVLTVEDVFGKAK